MEVCRFEGKTPLIHLASGCFVTNGNWMHMERNLDGFVLIVGQKGHLYIQQGDAKYTIGPGQAMLLLPNMVHKGYLKSDHETSYYWCHFTTNGQYSIAAKSVFDFSEEAQIVLPIYETFEDNEHITGIFKQLILCAQKNQHTKDICNHLLTALAMEVTESVLSNGSQSEQVDQKFIEIMEWLRLNYNQNMTLFEVAEKFNYNASYLARRFKDCIGIGPKQFILQIRLTKAKELLINSNLTIKEVSFEVGFEDEKHFMKLFKEKEMISPTQYRMTGWSRHLNNEKNEMM